MIRVYLNSVEDGQSWFIPVIPRGGMIKDIILYRPYEPGENMDVEFRNDNSEVIGTYPQLFTNKLHSINLKAEGQTPCMVNSPDMKELVVFYEV